ncbi:hypothetical protein [Acutalibacter caecimuris]|uniref:hypothetical protein n=1 Tax=Acutalibacter caecimuris TaxID=3093657 RepID=UPI002AC9A164|nr:hypothetical protein [Acutalibacter sp. M00118]
MEIMETLCRTGLCIIAGAFGLLSAVAALSRVRGAYPAPHVLMAIGGIGLLNAVIDNLVGGSSDWLLALIACGMICAAAIWNGRRAGALHGSHHLVRISLSTLLVAGFILL